MINRTILQVQLFEPHYSDSSKLEIVKTKINFAFLPDVVPLRFTNTNFLNLTHLFSKLNVKSYVLGESNFLHFLGKTFYDKLKYKCGA